MYKMPRSGPKWLEAGLFACGAGLTLVGVIQVMTGSKDMFLVGGGFVVIGIGLLLPRAVAVRWWHATKASIVAVDPDDEAPTLTFEYTFEGKDFSGSITETSSLRVGDCVKLRVNPNHPEERFAMTATPEILGWLFVGLGLVAALSGEQL